MVNSNSDSWPRPSREFRKNGDSFGRSFSAARRTRTRTLKSDPSKSNDVHSTVRGMHREKMQDWSVGASEYTGVRTITDEFPVAVCY